MPIKFRCEHCRQFLGISRSKAGELVDCPTCGRTLRVPQLDGTREPIPDPKLDMQDSSLAGALDALAMIGRDQPAGVAVKEAKPIAPIKPVQVKTLEPLATPEPIVIEAPPPVEPVSVSSPKNRPGKPATANKSSNPDAALRELAEITPAGEPPQRPGVGQLEGSFASKILRSLHSRYVLGILTSVAAIALLVGYLAGRSGSDSNASSAEKKSGKSENRNPRKIVPHVPANLKLVVQGTVHYKTPDGDRLVDAGARIILLPKNWKGNARISAAGFWANAKEDDFRISLAALQQMGGDADVADKDGKFEIHLPASAANYHLLAISAHRKHGGDESLPKSVGKYFHEPDTLIRELSFKVSGINYKGGAPVSRHFDFE